MNIKNQPPRHGEKARPVAAAELAGLVENCLVACNYYGLSRESFEQALKSARANPSKAGKCYAAIVRSL